MGLDTNKVPGMTVNRYCYQVFETIAIATAKIENGMANTGGVESMSVMAMGGWRIVRILKSAKKTLHGIGEWGSQLKQWQISLKCRVKIKISLP